MLRAQITEAMKDAMRARDIETLSTVRMILAGIKDKDIAPVPAATPAESAIPRSCRCSSRW